MALEQGEVDGVPEGRNTNHPSGYAPRESNNPLNRTAGGNGVLVDERRTISGVRRASIPGEHDEVGRAGKRRVDGKEGGVSTNKSSTLGESSRSRMTVASACSDDTAAAAGSEYVSVGLRSKGGAREATTTTAKAVLQGPKRVAGFSIEDNGGRVSSGVGEKTLVDPVNDPPLLLPQPQRRHSAGGERNGTGNKTRARDRRRSSEPPPTATYSRSALGTLGEDLASTATTGDIPPATFDCLPAHGGRYHSSKNGRPTTAKATEIRGKGQSDGVEQQQFGRRRGKRMPSGAAGGAEFCRDRATLDICTMSGSKGDDGSLYTDGRNVRSGGSGRGVAMGVITEPVGGKRERELGAGVDARGDYGRALLGGEDSSEMSYGRAATVWGGMPERQLDMSVDASADSTPVDVVASEEDSSAVRVGGMVLPLKVASRGKSVPREGIVPGGVPPAGEVKKGQAIEVADSVATGSTLSLSGPATNERSPDTGYADSAGVEGYCPPEGARDDITVEGKASPSFSSIVDTREQDLSDGRFLLQRGRHNAVAIAIDGDSYDVNEESPLEGLGGLSPGAGAGAVSSENGSREGGREDSGLSGGDAVADGNANGGFLEGSGEASAMDGSGGGRGGGQQEKHHGGSSAPAVGGVRPSVSSSSGGGKKEEERDTLGGEKDLGGESESEDEEFNYSIKTDHFGFFVTSDRRGPDVPPEVARLRRLKEGKRSGKWRTMMANLGQWRSGRKGKRFRKRVRKGIPDCVRGKVWQMMSGSLAMMEKEPNMYANLVASNLPVDGPIEEDIPRTMYDHEMFCRKSRVDGRSMLRRVLTAYGRYDREVQYCQGINYICALFLLYMPEENAFWLLVACMNREQAPLRDLFLPGMVKAQEFQFVVDSLTEKYCHELSAQIIRYNLTPAMYATQWFLTAFTQRFPYEFVTRIWDIFLLEDWKVFYRVCLALFKSVEDQAVKLDLENMNLLLRNMPLKVDAEEILKIANSIPLKHRHVEKRVTAFHRVRGGK